jgi:hypothetical protein
LVTLDWVIEKINQFVFHKAFKMEDEKTEFYHFFEHDFIMKYYSDSEQTPLINEIEKE